jgi:hypothetical protein
MNKIISCNTSIKHQLWLSFGIGGGIFVIMFFTEPYGLWKFNLETKFFLTFVYGVISMASYIVALFYQVFIFKKRNKWYIKDEVVFDLIYVIVGTVLKNLMYQNGSSYHIPSHLNLDEECPRIVHVPAVIMMLPFVMIVRYFITKITLKQKNINSKILIKGDSENEYIQLEFKQLLYIQSSNVYFEVNYIENDSINKKILRGKISTQQENFPKLLKPHRSFLINPHHFKCFKNKRAQLFISLHYAVDIPVSRSYRKEIKKKLPLATL